MFHTTCNTTFGEASNLYEHNTRLRKGEAPRSTLPPNVKKSQTNLRSTNISSIYSFTEMPHSLLPGPPVEIDDIVLSQNDIPSAMQYGVASYPSRDTSFQCNDAHYLDSAYLDQDPSSFYCNSTTTVEATKQHDYLSTTYPQHTYGTQLDKLRSRPLPSSQSTKASPSERSSPFSSPVHPSPALPLHQPRPSRRIPIVSLSQLALACDKIENTPHRRHAPYRHRADSSSRNNHYSHQRQSPYSKLNRDRQVPWQDYQWGDNGMGRCAPHSNDCLEVYTASWNADP